MKASRPYLDAHPLADDLRHVLAHTGEQWEALRGQRLFLTGGTGFFGCWLLESFLAADEAHNLGAGVTVLTREPAAFLRKAPRLAGHPAVTLHPGDVRTFGFPAGEFFGVIHAAAEVQGDRQAQRDSVDGTRRTLDFAAAAGTTRYLFTSSGAVHGPQPPEVSHLPEDFAGSLLPSAYGEGKKEAEELCLKAGGHFACVIARAFAFVGPGLPLDGPYAAGNFLRDAVAGGPIQVAGDGRPVRSYLYAADLAIWLWTLFFRGVSGRAYHVGSERAISVGELANAIARAAGLLPGSVIIGQSAGDGPAPRYVPATGRPRAEFGLREWVPLEDALARTVAYLRRPAPDLVLAVDAGSREGLNRP